MAETKTIRIDDVEDPDRQRKFEDALKRTACNGNTVIRKLIDAWLAHEREHHAAPSFPVKLVPVGTKKPH